MGRKLTKNIKKPSKLELLFKALLDDIVCCYCICVLVTLPIYNKGTYTSIGTNKVAYALSFFKFFSIVSLIVFTLYIFQCIDIKCSFVVLVKRMYKSFSLTDKFVVGYILSNIISFLCSDYLEVAFWGSTGWGQGLFTQLVLLFSYFFISRFWKRRMWIVGLIFPVSLFLFVIGISNRFNIYPIAIEASENVQFISLIGNINWYCGYMVIIIFGAIGLLWNTNIGNKYKVLLYLYLFISFIALVTNGSSSGILTLLVVFWIMLILSTCERHYLKIYFEMIIIFSVSCIFVMILRLIYPNRINYHELAMDIFTQSVLPVLICVIAVCIRFILEKTKKYPYKSIVKLMRFLNILLLLILSAFTMLIIVNTIFPGCLGSLSQLGIFTFSSEWGSRRGATWTAGLKIWLEQSWWKKIVGIGSECFRSYLYTDASRQLFDYVNSVWPVEHNIYLTNAHCEVLNILIEKGVLGALCYIGIILSVAFRYIRLPSEGEKFEKTIILCCGLGVLAYAIHNLVSFQQIVNGTTMFVALGIGESFFRNTKKYNTNR